MKLCLLAMMISFGLSLDDILKNLPRTSAFASTWDKVPALQYRLAVAVIGFIMELAFFVYYLIGLNVKFVEELLRSKAIMTLVITIYHVLMWVFLFVAPIVLHITWTGKSVTAYIAFATLALIGYSRELYLILYG